MKVEAWLTRAARRRPDCIAIETLERSVSYRELDRLAGAGARELGVPAGSRVVIALAPGVDFAIALHACMRAGAIAVPLDLRDPARRLPAADAIVESPLACAGAPLAAGAHDLNATAVIVSTSGTTGQPKEVPLTYGNFLWSAIGSAVALGVDDGDRWLCTLPLVHVGGLSIILRSSIYATAAVIHERFATEDALDALMERRITLVSVVATTLTRLLDGGLAHPPALRCALAGGGPVAAGLLARARGAGVPVSQTYGLTEACSQVATQAPGEGGVDSGPPLFCTGVQIAPDGEIIVRGPTISPAVPGGVLSTGDLGEIAADGSLRVIGRSSDTIISGGENVSPSEVEATLEEHPAVLEAGVYGVPDERWGEAVQAVVVVSAAIGEQELREFCARRLASFKVPKAISFAGRLPRTGSGKLQRSSLPVDGAGRRT